MTQRDSWAERWLYIVNELENGNASAVARAVGARSPQTVLNWANGSHVPGGEIIETAVRHYRLNPEWMLTGKGDPRVPPNPDDAQRAWMRIMRVVEEERARMEPTLTPEAEASLAAEAHEAVQPEPPARKRAAGGQGRRRGRGKR